MSDVAVPVSDVGAPLDSGVVDALSPKFIAAPAQIINSLVRQQIIVRSDDFQTWTISIATGLIADNAITDAKLRDSSACSVIGRSANSTGDPADIACDTDGKFMVRRSNVLTFDTILDADIPAAIARDAEVTSAVAALSSVYQPLDADLTAIAALATTAYGRSLLTLASLVATQQSLKIPIPLFEFNADVGNVTTGETDLFTSTLAAGQLANNKEKIEVEYAGVFVSSGTATRQLRVYFGGTVIFDSGALTLSLSSAWVIYVTVIRVSASVVRCSVSMTTEGAALASYTQYAEVTGLTLASTQVIKVTGQAAGIGAATNDLVGKLGYINWVPAA